MKITIDASEDEVSALKSAGMLRGANVLMRVPKKRRRLSASNEEVLSLRLTELRAYKQKNGTFDVPRTGRDRELGEWVDKLKETYVKAPDGDRIGYLAEFAPDLLGYLQSWASTKISKATVRPAPLWLNAAWVAEFMEAHRSAPTQASLNPDEVAMAKWLSRWSNKEALERLVGKDPSAAVVMALDDLARGLRTRRGDEELGRFRTQATSWRGSVLYVQIGKLCESDKGWIGRVENRALFDRSQSIGGNFWPSLSQWHSEADVWLPEQLMGKRNGV